MAGLNKLHLGVWGRNTIKRVVVPYLDDYTGASFAISLNKIRTDYTGYCLRVRRSSDDAEMDIGFNDKNSLDLVTLLSFCAGGDGYIRTWYDQSGNGKDAYQTTNSYQPSIVLSGVVNKIEKIPAVLFSSTLTSVKKFLDVTPFSFTLASVFSVDYKLSSDNNSRIISFNAAGQVDYVDNQKCANFRNSGLRRLDCGISLSGTDLKDQVIVASNHIQNTQGVVINKAGTLIDNTLSQAPRICNPDEIQIGTEGNRDASVRYKVGYVMETVFYAFDNYSNDANIKNEINKYYLAEI